MTLLGAGSILPGWIVGPVAAVMLVAIAAHVLAMHATPMPVRRRRIRTVNGLLMMLVTALLGYALGGLPQVQRPIAAPAETKLFLLVWFTIIGLVGMIVMLAAMDSLHTLVLGMSTRKRLRQELRQRLAESWRRHAEANSPTAAAAGGSGDKPGASGESHEQDGRDAHGR